MSRAKRVMSPATADVLRAIDAGASYGFDVMDRTGLASGTVYPILSRLRRRGLVEATWEDPGAERQGGRPPRRYYRLTPEGRAALARALARFRELGRPLPEPGR